MFIDYCVSGHSFLPSSFWVVHFDFFVRKRHFMGEWKLVFQFETESLSIHKFGCKTVSYYPAFQFKYETTFHSAVVCNAHTTSYHQLRHVIKRFTWSITSSKNLTHILAINIFPCEGRPFSETSSQWMNFVKRFCYNILLSQNVGFTLILNLLFGMERLFAYLPINITWSVN